MHTTIKSGDVSNMKDFDVSTLKDILSVCHGVRISHGGIVLDVGHIRVAIIEGSIGFYGDVIRIYSFDEVSIKWGVIDAATVVFIIKYGDTEIYLPVDIRGV
jgi:hypothetical protein